jgi:hypothetical protein
VNSVKIPIKKERIFRALSVERPSSVSELSRATGLAKSYVSRVIRDLAKRGVVWGQLQTEPELLVREWGSLKRQIFETLKPLRLDVLILDRIKGVFSEYAVSGPFAEFLVQGGSPGRPLILYTTSQELSERRRQVLQLGRVGRGQLWIYTYDPHVFAGSWVLRGWRLASVPQIAADLVALGTYADLGIELLRRWLDAGGGVPGSH